MDKEPLFLGGEQERMPETEKNLSLPELRVLRDVVAEERGSAANPFLSLMMRRLRSQVEVSDEVLEESRAGYYFIPGRYAGKPYDYPSVYFATSGCRYDKAGACTMCNFGRGSQYSEDEVFAAVQPIIERFSGEPAILITPQGSMLDDREVSPAQRRRILQSVAEEGFRHFETESRVEFVSEEKIKELRETLGDAVRIEMGMGLETSDPMISKYSVNKMFSQEDYLRAVEVLKKYGVGTFAHVLLKPAFLTEREAYDDATATITWAFAHGTDQAGIALTNLKKGTLLHWLAENGRYEPPTYWTVIKILKDLPKEMRDRVTLFGFDSGIIIQKEAGNCPRCTPVVKQFLLDYLRTRDDRVLDQAAAYECSCKGEWEKEMEQRAPPLVTRLPQEYEFIARGVMGEEWTQKNAQVLHKSLPHS